VEAGKKAAGEVLALQKRVLAVLNEARYGVTCLKISGFSVIARVDTILFSLSIKDMTIGGSISIFYSSYSPFVFSIHTYDSLQKYCPIKSKLHFICVYIQLQGAC
jgi:hypothetical protein